MKIEINVSDVENFKEAFKSMCDRTLTRWGMAAEGYAKEELSKPKLHADGQMRPTVDTGNLRNSISNRVDEAEQAVYIGTNNEYATYVELGTGKYVQGGRPDPWVYQDDNGNWHHTNGQRAQPYLKPAITEHKKTYENILEDELKSLF